MKDPEFLALTEKQNLDLDPRPGEKTEEFLRRAHASPPAVIETAHKLLGD